MVRSILTRFIRSVASKLNIEASDALLLGTLGSLFIMSFGTLFTFINTVLLSRILGPAWLGIYSFSQALVLFLAAPLSMGISQLLTRQIAAYSASEDFNSIRAVIAWSTKIGLLIALPAIALLAAIFGVWENRFGSDKLYTLLWALPLLPLGVLIHINGASLRALGHMVKGQLNDIFTRPFLFTLFLLLIILLPNIKDTSPAEAMALHILATLIALAVSAWMRAKVLPSGTTDTIVERSGGHEIWRRSFFTFALFGGIGAVQLYMDVIVLGLLTDDMTVGIYRVAAQGMMLITAAALAIQVALSPSISKLHALKDIDGIQHILTTGARVTLLVTLPAIVVIAVFAEPILTTVFGTEYAGGKTALGILVLGSLSYGLIGLGGPTLNMTGNETRALRAAGIGAGVNLALNFLLIPIFGMEGAALATVSSLFVTQILWAWYVRKQLGVSCFILSTMKPAPPLN